MFHKGFVPYFLLLLSLQKMDKRNYNGPEFKYRVMWRKVLGSGPNWHTHHAIAPPFIVEDIGNFSAFEIKVQAVNEKGEGPEPDPVIGYSGEDGKIKKRLTAVQSVFFYLEYFLVYLSSHVVCHILSVPLEAPMDVGIVLLNSTSIRVTWAAVKKETVRGHLLGYKVQNLSLLGCLAKTHPAIVLMNNTITISQILVWQRLQSCLFVCLLFISGNLTLK